MHDFLPGYYQGAWVDGVYHGRGEDHVVGSHTYIGDFVQGEMHGLGHIRYASGGEYEGSFANGQRHGVGLEKLAQSKDTRSGIWQHDVYVGADPRVKLFTGKRERTRVASGRGANYRVFERNPKHDL